MNARSLESSKQGAAQPVYILRGHVAQIHALNFLRSNTRLLTGDADGWIILWDMPIRRPCAVWKAHTNTVLGITSWGEEKIITHGREGKIYVWKLSGSDEMSMSKVLPVDDGTSERKSPWLLHSLHVHALNFCSFAISNDPASTLEASEEDAKQNILLAVSGLQDGSINIESLPSETRYATIPSPKDVKVGMLMAVGLHRTENDELIILAGYESGHAAVWSKTTSGWQAVYLEKAHSQPVMSLDIAHEAQSFYTSSADAIIAQYSFIDGTVSMKTVQTKHSGQQSLQVRDDEKIFATAGWDGRARVYSTNSMKELAVLKWHKDGCYAIAFAQTQHDESTDNESKATTVAEKRVASTKTTHWLAVGSKDGKISLWDIY